MTLKSHNGVTLVNADKHKVADSLAREWGEIQGVSTIFNKRGLLIKNYSCSGHGGYVVVSDKKIESLKADYSVESYSGWQEYFGEFRFYVYTFEEDCEWSRLFLMGKEDIRNSMDYEWSSKVSGTGETKSLMEYAKSTANNYFAGLQEMTI